MIIHDLYGPLKIDKYKIIESAGNTRNSEII